MAEFEYSSLDPMKKEIRILRPLLQARSDEDEAAARMQTNDMITDIIVDPDLSLQFELCVVSLDESPQYTALSYVWGDPSDPRPILVNGSTFMATQNLYAALEHMQYADIAPALWVDAVCINQRDDDEKNTQVPYMGSIYSSARHVFVWLGPQTEDSDLIARMIREITDGLHRAYSIPTSQKDRLVERFLPFLQEAVVPTIAYISKSMAPIDFFKAFVNCITDRSWWWRVWTVQEFYLPQRVQFQIGLRRIPLEEFDLVFQVLTSAYKSTFGRTDEQYLAETRWINGFDRITQMLNLRRGRQIDIFGNNGLYEVLCRTYCPFRFQESDTYLLKATCRIDQIYGLVALYDDFDVLGLTIDYRKTWQEVYSDVAQSLILTDNMDVLAFCQRENASQSSTLPSWVPIWHEQFDTPHAWWKAPRKPDLSALGNSLFSAASNFTVEVSFETTVNTSGQSTRSMQIEGVFVDEVSEIKSQYFRAASIHYTEKKEFVYVLYGMLLGEIQALCDLSRSLKNAKYTPTSLQDAAWRIPVWDHEIQEDASWTRAGEATRLRYQQCMPVYETVQKHMDQVKLSADSSKVLQFPLLQLGAQINEILRQYMSPIILGRPSKPFMTRNGYLGMGPASMEPTDSVCLLFGARVPCVLRKRPGEEGGYVFVGEAFVYGIMDGEFLREDQLSTTFEIF